jgi:hypothetical protein
MKSLVNRKKWPLRLARTWAQDFLPFASIMKLLSAMAFGPPLV